MQEALTRIPPKITQRQLQVIELIAAGCSNEEVGERLGISPRTAKAHCDVLRQKLGVARRRQIPVAYRLLTGVPPFAPPPGRVGPAGGDGRPRAGAPALPRLPQTDSRGYAEGRLASR